MKASFKYRQETILLVFTCACLAATVLPAAEPKTATYKTRTGVEMRYITLGDSGSWVVLIPGLSDNPQRMYIDSGIAAALAKNHRVVALPDPGTYKPEDPIELMDHLQIDKAHIYGYSQGGGYTGTMLALHPERFITVGFGGSGIWEYDQEQHDRATALDQALMEQAGRGGRGAGGGRSATGDRAGRSGFPPSGGARRGGRDGGSDAAAAKATATDAKPADNLRVPVAAARPHSRTPIDLSTVTIPVLSINGTLDQPYAKTERMYRELRDFQNVFLPGHDHMSAIGVRTTFPQQHVDAVVRFINANDTQSARP